MLHLPLSLLGSAGLLLSTVAAWACEPDPWLTYQGTQVWSVPPGPAFAYSTGRMAIDADGAPNAYHGR
jgi:hypothetical protein